MDGARLVASAVPGIVAAVAVLCALMLLWSIGAGIVRITRRRAFGKAEARYGMKILEAGVFAPDASGTSIDIPDWAAPTVRLLILRRLFRHGGTMRENLVRLYRTLGYLALDRGNLKHRSKLMRLHAVIITGIAGDTDDLPALRAALDDRDALVRLGAVRSLCRHKDLVWLNALPQLLARTPADHRTRMAEMAAEIGGDLTAALRPFIDSGADAAARLFAIDAAGAAGLTDLLDALMAAREANDNEVRVRVARALARMSTPPKGWASAPPAPWRPRTAGALRALATDEAWQVRAQAVKGLRYHAGVESLKTLGRALCDVNFWVRSNAAASLSALDDSGRQLLEVAVSWPDRFAADTARQALSLGAAGLADEEF